ncbi:hypothetical protein P4H65_23995 [Paenibacillus chitinolyticus]|uniref:hypothetical protein n=1 Tax=Paenibacillus chitinolyticus TaxID=79263 RepID=UPI002DBDC2E9|nr:hypothetical protein [Paenibacillus chitinolyticus]MEC0248859.1 hypothetical protein [Paenibacillus chitinolyticus]
MVKADLVYVLTNVESGRIEMATGDDAEAWAFFRDVRDIKISIFLNKNLVSEVKPLIVPFP